ncbi:tetratricopeptide (TPR) repeat protein [Paenibacillus rhizosphaerae]|uniref:Tetratricopeptide (TPR) repeat protein n=1 Tax=Paenibacillus rhizosphaerae TaxID=297318 RepID=A0A839TJ68_9BACL|nr:carboxypeptidase-like regulatory domain-containing protein [Paenibacillus rhizosphaerae]MBB3125800.1 tetratricopeptide (TPR) repeat protein [Paenibacillus rhizosphaerae]
MKVTIKVKHLILSTAVFLLLAAGFLVALSRQSPPSQNTNQAVWSNLSKQEVFKRIRESEDEQKWTYIRNYLIGREGAELTNSYDIYVGPGTSEWSSVTYEGQGKLPPITLKEKFPYLEAYVESGPADFNLAGAALLLSYYYEGAGQWEKAIELLERTDERLPASQMYAAQKVKIRMAEVAGNHGDMDLFRQISADLSHELTQNPDTRIVEKFSWLQTRYLAGNESIQQYLKALKKWEGSPVYGSGKQPTVIFDQPTLLKQGLQKLAASKSDRLPEVSGTLKRSDGSPIAYAGVYLRTKDRVQGSLQSDEPYQTMTNGKGEYTIKGVLPGSYQLYLGLELDQISGWTWPTESNEWIRVGFQDVTRDAVLQPLLELAFPVNQTTVREDRITFAWEPVPKAAYYDIYLGVRIHSGSVSQPVKTKVDTTRITIKTEELYHLIGGISSYSDQDRKMITDPLSLLGFSNPDNRFFWTVNAYDNDGHLLTRSDGYRIGNDKIGNLPFFYLKERELTLADRTLLAGNLDQAMKQYEQAYKDDPADTHSLHMLIVMIDAQISEHRSNGSDSFDRENAEKQQETYLKEMVLLHPTSGYLSRLTDYYYKKKDWQAYNAYYKLYEKAMARDS